MSSDDEMPLATMKKNLREPKFPNGSVLTPAKTQGVTDDIDIEMVRKSQEFQTATPTFTTQ